MPWQPIRIGDRVYELPLWQFSNSGVAPTATQSQYPEERLDISLNAVGLVNYAVHKQGDLYRTLRADGADLGALSDFGEIVTAVDADAGVNEVLLQITSGCGIVPVTTPAEWPSGRTKPFRVRCDLKFGNGIALSDTARTAFNVTSGTSVSDMRSYDWFHWEQGTLDPNYLSWTTVRDPDSFFGVKSTNTGRQKYVQFRNNKWDSFVMLTGPNPNEIAISAAAAGTGGVIRLTVTHTLNWAENEQVRVVRLNASANPPANWPAHIVDATHIELVGSTFTTDTYTGGTVAGLEFAWINLDSMEDAPTADDESLGCRNIQITNFEGPADGSLIGFSKLFHVGSKVQTKETGGLVGANHFSSGIEIGWGTVRTNSDVTLSTDDQNVGGIQLGFYGEVIDAYVHHLELSGFGDIPVQIANYRRALIEEVTAIDSHGFSTTVKRPATTPRQITWLNCRQVNQYRTNGIIGWNVTTEDVYSGAIAPLEMGAVVIDGPESRMDFFNPDSMYSAIRRPLFVHVSSNPFYLKARIAINDGSDTIPWVYDGAVGGNNTPAGLVYIACGVQGVARPKIDLTLPLRVRGETINSGSGKTAYKFVQFRKGANVDVTLDVPVIDIEIAGDGLDNKKLKLVEHSFGAVNEIATVFVNKESGTFTLTVEIVSPPSSDTTGPLNFDTGTGAMKTALEALSTVGAGNVDSVTIDTDTGGYVITYALGIGARVTSSATADVVVERTHKYNEPSHESGTTRLVFQNLTGCTNPVAESWDLDADLAGPYRSQGWDTTGAPASLIKQEYIGARPAKFMADASAGGAAPKNVGLMFRGNGNVVTTGVGDIHGFEVTVQDDFTATQIGYNVQVSAGNLELLVLDPADSYNRIATTGQVACPGTGAAHTALTASLTLMKGQRVFICWATDSATAALAGELSGLPYGTVGKITAPVGPPPLPVSATPGTPVFGSVGKCASLLLIP